MKIAISKKIKATLAQSIRDALKACVSYETQNSCNARVFRCGYVNRAVIDVTAREGQTCSSFVRDEMIESLADEGIDVYSWSWCTDGGLLFVRPFGKANR